MNAITSDLIDIVRGTRSAETREVLKDVLQTLHEKETGRQHTRLVNRRERQLRELENMIECAEFAAQYS